jgi:hypothetical protein
MRKGLLIAAVAALGVAAAAQEKEDRTLLSQEQMNAIINEASGERAMHHVQELVPYQFVRPPSEYQGHFRESEVMAKFAKEYGFTNVAIEDFPTGQTWQPIAEIRDFLSGEFEPVPLADVMGVLRAREAAGTIKLVPRR